MGRRAAGPPWATTGVASEEAFPAFVCAVLEEHAAKIEGCELHARATTFSSLVAADKWRATGGSLDEATRTAIFDACRRARVPHGSWPLGPERLVAVRHVGGKVVPGGRASLGVVLGVYPAVVDDVVIARHLDSIAHDLLVGARLARRLGDSAALSTLASTLARAGTRAQALEQMGLVLRERTRSCHAKVYVARWHDGQRQIQRMLRTDRPSAAPRTYPLRSDLGFADWVFRRRQWLLISEITNGDAEPDRGLSEDGEVCVLGRPSRMIDPSDAINDDERSLLLVPMWSDGQVLGVLSVWRETPDLYDPDLDQQSMEYFAHAVLSACRWRVEADANQHATDSVRELERVLRRGPAPGELYRAFTERAVTLASAAGGALFLRDDERREVAYPLAVVSGDLATLDGAMLAVAASVGAGDLPPALEAHLAERAHKSSAVLRGIEVLAVPGGEAALALFDRCDGGDRHTLDEATLRATARAFAEQGGAVIFGRGESALIHHATEGIANAWIDVSDGGRPTDPEAQIQDAARLTAKLVHDRTSCDAVLIYQREPGRLSVVGVWPESMRVKGRAASASTLATLSHGGPSYVLDALEVGSAAAADVVRDAAALAADLGWPGVRSLLVIPVIVDDRPVGAVKLLTRASGRYIDRASFLVAKAITARVAVELVRWARYQRLSTLNTMASELAAAGPGRFEREVATRLDVWAQRYIDASVHTLVIASIDGVRLKVFSSCGDIRADVFQHDNDAWLQALLAGWLANPLVVPDARGLTLGARAGAQTVHFERVPLPPGRGVAAWLLLFAERSFTREDVAAAHEAARELMIFFDHERQRHLWSLELARYRHAVIGPAQGLASAARMLHRLARDGGDAAAVARFGRMVEREATSIRLWRENQRLYASDTVKVAPRRNELRLVVDACCARFRDALLDRNIELHTRWLCPQGFVFEFDADALDLVLSNLVDNARKYAFYNTEVTIEARLAEGHMVHITVEDVGHDIPERMREDVYRIGQRLDWRDPIREIEGTGLGLPMARALVERHGGRLTHESRPLGVSNGVSRALVRFVVALPRRAAE